MVGLYDTKITSQYFRLFSNNYILKDKKILNIFAPEVTVAVELHS